MNQNRQGGDKMVAEPGDEPIGPFDSADVPAADAPSDARGVAHLGHQHAVPARRGTHQHRGVCRERILHGRDGRLRGADRRGRRHAGPPDVVSARHVDALRVDVALSSGVAALGADVGVGDRVDAARARLHVFFRRGRSVARGRADVHRLPAGRRQAGGRVRQRGDRRRRRDARRVRCRRSHRPGDESRRART